MTHYDRATHLKSVHAKRKSITYKKVDDAFKRLIKAQARINFNSVASEAGVSKSTLYNNPDIRTRIETLRAQQEKVLTPKQVKREMSESNKDALISSLKRKVQKLQDENKQLKEKLKVVYADVYKQI